MSVVRIVRKKSARSSQPDRNYQGRQDLDQAVPRENCEELCECFMDGRSGLAHVFGYEDLATSAPTFDTYSNNGRQERTTDYTGLIRNFYQGRRKTLWSLKEMDSTRLLEPGVVSLLNRKGKNGDDLGSHIAAETLTSLLAYAFDQG
ncbi:hypothetical protein J6590_094756 [Homalodisca vitripennis]|nr:hypothetical protein J6590_094080 [Homalodisca vitripennis]KAG8275041.1 hypothetical protein J6590_094756 [Homalodisca vitripennis]